MVFNIICFLRYATRMVAHISKQVQEQRKKQYVSLFTDLANPTSNAMYPFNNIFVIIVLLYHFLYS